MKRIAFVIGIMLIFIPLKLNARCDYQEVIDLNKLASNVEYEYEYERNTNTFKLTFYNIVNDIKIQVNSESLSARNNIVTKEGFPEGENVIAYVQVNKYTECSVRTDLRIIYINIPYINPYYNTRDCEGYESLSVCNSEFLSYYLTYVMLERAKENYDNAIVIEPPKVEEEKVIWYESILDFLKKYYIPAIIIIVSTILSVLVGNRILNRIKHGF